MQSLFINRQSSARPITSPKKGRSRWSRRRRTTLTGPDIISEAGALILTAPCEPGVSFVRNSVGAKSVDFPTVKSSWGLPRETTSVRILAAASAASPVRLLRPARSLGTRQNAAGPGAGAWPPRGGQRRRTAGEAKERARVSAPRVASSRHSTRTHRSSAARRAFVTVGNARRAAARWMPLAGE